ncbi:hypothetical protein [Pengzhenrongella phosphoraccumulans]|uniref:hypothetical protein n=1 Tax=Pengzhenrongella phosphoraccumulans TaxID=3114394 RepID=UPI00388E4A3D
MTGAQLQDRRLDDSMLISDRTPTDHDVDRLRTTRFLTLLNTHVPEGFFNPEDKDQGAAVWSASAQQKDVTC